MGFMRKTRVARRSVLFALVLAIAIGAALPAVHAISQDPDVRSEHMGYTINRAPKGNRLKSAPSEDAAQKRGGKRMDLRPRVTRLAGI